MNVGIFSGSFNPVHIGHLILANYVTEFTDIDEVWFLVTPQNPWKKNKGLIDEDLRFEMTKKAIAGYPKLHVSDIEFSLPRPSYTINTFDELKKLCPEYNFSLIIGADNWEFFGNWKDFQKILDNYKIYVYPRLGHSISVPAEFKKSVEIVDSPIIEISSTFIREGIKAGKNIKAFLPESVYHYIEYNKLYI